MADEGTTLELFSQSKLGAPVSAGPLTLTANPVIDLAASVHDNNAVHLWRADDQVVSKLAERGQTVGIVRWKEDGQFLAAAWNDGVVRLTGLENAKAVHHIRVMEKGCVNSICWIAWAQNRTRKTKAAAEGATSSLNGGRSALDRLLSEEIELSDREQLLDLPHELTFLEVDAALPKISPLPISGGTGDDMFVFSTRSSLEFIFGPRKTDDTGIVDVMVVGLADGSLHLSINDSFVIGTFANFLRGLPSPTDKLQLCGHSSDPDISTHVLLFRLDGEPGKAVYFLPMDLTFVHSSPVNLTLLASKTTMLQNLLRYVKQTNSHMTGEWAATRKLPARFLSSVHQDLKKMPRGPMTIEQALYHTAVTGHVHRPVKEWLADVVGERGHKRWDKEILTGLENLRALLHENFLPALERCAIILSRLYGLSRFHLSRDPIGFTPPQMQRLLDAVSCLTLVGHRVLVQVMDEMDRFRVFSLWLRYEIEKIASPSMADDMTERASLLDMMGVLTYIEGHLTKSPLELYMEPLADTDYVWLGQGQIPKKEIDTKAKGKAKEGKTQLRAEDIWKKIEEEPELLELVDKQIEKHEQGQPCMKPLTNLAFLLGFLTNQASTVFANIAETQRRSVRFGLPTELAVEGTIRKTDMRVCSRSEPNAQDMVAYTAVVADDKRDEVCLFRCSTPIINGISGATSTSVCRVGVQDRIVDVKFLDDEALIVLCHHHKATNSSSSKSLLLRLPYQPSASLPYFAYHPDKPLPIRLVHETPTSCAQAFMPMELASPSAGNTKPFHPARMEIRRRTSLRGETPGRICLLGCDGVTYRMYTVPAKWTTTCSRARELEEVGGVVGEEKGNEGAGTPRDGDVDMGI